MLDLVNNLTVRMRKYRRGDDYRHFQFTTSIYPAKLAERNESLHVGDCHSTACPYGSSQTLPYTWRALLGHESCRDQQDSQEDQRRGELQVGTDQQSNGEGVGV